jgi:hypothetical protein
MENAATGFETVFTLNLLGAEAPLHATWPSVIDSFKFRQEKDHSM